MNDARTPGAAAAFSRVLRTLAVPALIACALVLASASLAFAGNEGGSTDPDRIDCESCHSSAFVDGYGPHGFYSTIGDKCQTCHVLHASGGTKCLPRATVKDTCFACHDGTGGQGVYGALASRGIAVAGGHSVDTTNMIPGGDPNTGGAAPRSFIGAGSMLGCDDCHSPHNNNVVNDFRAERFRGGLGLGLGYYYPDAGPSSKLLRRKPTGASTETTEYGSDWCAACHSGRSSGGLVHNHPVDSKATNASPFYFNRVAILDSGNVTSHTVIAAMTDGPASKPTNRGFLMPYPRTAQQASHYPICQQCHADARNVGTMNADGSAKAATLTVTATAFAGQYPATDNPRFQNFPHEAANPNMLVETDDDLCLNCHPAQALP